jgi:hypothetical protein
LFFVIDEKNNSVNLTTQGINLITRNGEDHHFFILPEISTKLALSTNTISTYKIRLLTKMNLKSIADVTKYALENHLM